MMFLITSEGEEISDDEEKGECLTVSQHNTSSGGTNDRADG